MSRRTLRVPWSTALGLILASLVVSQSMPTRAAEESHPGLAAEAMYAEAILAYNTNKISDAIKILDEVLEIEPGNIPALEMRALTLKIRGDDKRAVKIYQDLIKAKAGREAAPYHFELGTIYNRQKEAKLARQQFDRSLELGFNLIPTHLFLGILDFGESRFADAEGHFEFLKATAPPEIRVAARYYLGLTHFRAGLGASGTSEILEARALAQRLPEDPTARTILVGSEKILAPFSAPQWFGSLTSIGQYDSNVSQLPVGIVNPEQVSGKATPKLTLSAGLGRMTAPLRDLQFVGSYRASYNKNLNEKTKSLEYFTNFLSLYLNYRPLAQVTGGLKLEGSFGFQNQLQRDLGPDTYLFGKSSLLGEEGVFARAQVTRYLSMQADLFFRQNKSFTNPDLSGSALGVRVSARSTAPTRKFNPAGSLSFEKSSPAGLSFRYTAWACGLSNAFKLTEKDTLTPSVDVSFSSYSEGPIPRRDVTVPFRVSWIRSLASRWTLIGDVSVTKSFSTIPDAYSFNRLILGAGVGWSM